MLQPGVFLHVRRLPAVTARWWCGTSRSRYISVASLYAVKQPSVFTCTSSVCVIWSADLLVCPGRLRWPAGFCSRRPTTSPMPSLCVGWRGSPLQPRFVTPVHRLLGGNSLINMIHTTGDNLEVTGVFLCFCTVFGRSCGDKGSPVRARLLESHQLSVWWSPDSGKLPMDSQEPSCLGCHGYWYGRARWCSG